MITPKDMDKYTNNEVVKMYEKLNQDLTRNIIKKLRQAGDISSYTRSQMSTLKRIGGNEIFRESLQKTNSLSSKRKKEILKLFDEIADKEMIGYKSVYNQKGIEYKLSPEMIEILNYGISVGNKDVSNLTQSIAYASKKQYIKSVDNVYKEVITGAYDYKTSLKKGIKDLTKKGITLETSDGRNEQIDVAVKRNLYTGIQRTTKELAKEIGEQIDANCVVIGHSSKCRPSHHVIDAVIMSIDEFKKYEYLTEEYNCNHVVNYDWREEFDGTKNKKEYTDEHESYRATVRNYKIQQKANYYARQVREKKDAIAGGDKTFKAKMQLLQAQKKYREFCLNNNIEVDYDKTWKVGYNK